MPRHAPGRPCLYLGLLFCLLGSCVDPGDPIVPTAGYLARQAEYLQYCHDRNGPGQGGLHGQVCRLAGGADTFNEEAIDSACAKIQRRDDTADFDMNSVIRLLYLAREHPNLPGHIQEILETTVLAFKYWLDEPGPDTMCWWSENHQILFHSAELLAGQLFPDTAFTNSAMTGAEHVTHALPRLHRWLDFRGRFGFSEWHSNVYFNEDLPALVNLADFAEDDAIREKAAMVLDLLALDLASNTYRGLFATAHGRTYPGHILGGLNDSTREAAYILLGLGGYQSGGNFAGAFLATSEGYAPPAVLEDIARDAEAELEHRQRDSIDLEDGPRYGIRYASHEDVMFWWGATGYVAPPVIAGTFRMVEDFNLWEGFLWEDLAFLRPLVGCPLVPLVSLLLEPMMGGVTLESMSTYTFRRPHYQLSGAQDYKPGAWAAQVHAWQATLDEDAYVFTTYPGGMSDDYMGGPWTGGFLPRATFHENVGIIQYRRPEIPLLDDLLFTDYSHAYVPRRAFDTFVETEHWAVGRKGSGYVALYSQQPPIWSEDNDDEWIADAKENVWIVELGDEDASGPFQDFVAAVTSAEVSVGDTVIYRSPSQGLVTVGWDGPMEVAGSAVDLGPHPRWDNPYCQQAFGTRVTDIRLGEQRLELNFLRGMRRYWADSSG